MSRRKDNLLYLLALVPWQFSVGVALAVFLLMRFAAPALSAGSETLLDGLLTQMLPQLAPYFFVLFLLPAAVSFMRRRHRRGLLARQGSADSIRDLSWRQFEQLTAAALERDGYVVLDSPEGPDGGVDLVVLKDGKRYLVQCKQWRSRKVGVAKVRELCGVVAASEAGGGIFVASGDYTREARSFAAGSGIRLIGSAEIAEWVAASAPDSCSTMQAESSGAAPSCPKCRSPMVMRTARRGANSGKSFLGCSRFPDCRATRAV